MIREITITGIKEFEEGLKTFENQIRKPDNPLDQVGSFMVREAQRNFPRRGAVFGEPWKDYAKAGWRISPAGRRYWFPGTEIIKARAGFAGQPLMVRTGLLKSAFYVMQEKNQVEIYNPTSYAPEHQFGTRTLPRRVLLKLIKNQIDFIVNDIFVKWIEELIIKSFQK